MDIKQIVAQLKQLPTLPGVVVKISGMVESAEASAEDLGKIIATDQVLSARVLKLINSPIYGFPGRISSVTHGVVLLGFNVIKSLVLTASVFDIMIEQMKGLWEHSVGCAGIAARISRRFPSMDPEEISTAGLLHDLGKVVISYQLPEDYALIMRMVEKDKRFMMECEQEVLGVNHAGLLRWVVKDWNLPVTLVEPLLYHHKPALSRNAPLQTAIVHLADILVKACGYGISGDIYVPPLDEAAWKRLGFREEDVPVLVAEAKEEIESVDTFDLIG